MDSQPLQKHFRGVREVALFFGVSPDTVREWREAGAPFYYFGKKWHTNYDDIWNWLKNHYPQKLVK